MYLCYGWTADASPAHICQMCVLIFIIPVDTYICIYIYTCQVYMNQNISQAMEGLLTRHLSLYMKIYILHECVCIFPYT